MLEKIREKEMEFVLPTYARVDLAFESGSGAKLISVDGEEFIDFSSGIGVASLGHGSSIIKDTICLQASKLLHTSNLYHIPPQSECAKKIVELSGYSMKCFFANSGAEANEGAIKIARKYGEVEGRAKRYKVITLENSFHGRTISTLKATAQSSMHNYFGPFPDGFVYAKDIDEIEELLDDHTVAVMIELVQGEGGVQPLDRAQVKALELLLKSKDILLIIDEVQTGVYRTGEFLASQLYDITPDIVTLAKGLGGGVPIGVVMTSKSSVLGHGDHGSTFGGNYLSSSVAIAVLDELERYKQSGLLDEISIYFEQKVHNMYQKHSDLFVEHLGFGLMRGVRVRDAKTLSDIIANAIKYRVLVLKAGRNTLRFLPPLTITKEEIDEGFKRLESALSAL